METEYHPAGLIPLWFWLGLSFTLKDFHRIEVLVSLFFFSISVLVVVCSDKKK